MRGMDNKTANDKKVRAARLRAIRKAINTIKPVRETLRANIKKLVEVQKKHGQLGADIFALGITHPFGSLEAESIHEVRGRYYYMSVNNNGIISLGWFNGPVGKSGIATSSRHHAVSIHIYNIDARNASRNILNGYEKYEHALNADGIVEGAVAALPILVERLADNTQKAADIVTGDSPEKRAAKDAERFAKLAEDWFNDCLEAHAVLLPAIDAANEASDNNALPEEWCLLGGDLSVVNPALATFVDIPGSAVKTVLTFRRSRIDLVLVPKGGKPQGLLMFDPQNPHANHTPGILARGIAELAETLHYESAAAYDTLFASLDTMVAKKNAIFRVFGLDAAAAS